MARYPLLMLLMLAGATLVLTGADGLPEPAAPPEPPPSPAESAAAARLLDRAIEAYSPPSASWMEMALWQQIWEDGVGREVHGRYLAAPGARLRLELKVRVNRTEGELKLISDGQALWQSQRLGADPPATAQIELPKLTALLKTPEAVAQARAALLGEQTFLGVGPLLRVLRKQAQGLRRKAERWKDVAVIRVTGSWPEDPVKLAEVPDYQRPRHVPRLWSVYLDAATLWPHRLEWWGAAPSQGQPVLLFEMEFRDAVLNRPLPPERCAREFTIPPG